MSRNTKKLNDKSSDNQNTIYNWEKFIEMIFRTNSNQSYDKFGHKQIYEDVINNLVGVVLSEEVKGCHDEGNDDWESIYHLIDSWQHDIF